FRVPHGALNGAFLEQREQFFRLSGRDQLYIGAEGTSGTDLALEFVHALVVVGAGDLQAADTAVVTQLLVELAAGDGGVARHLIVRGHVTESGGVRGRADVGGDGRLVNADDVAPALLDQVVRHGRTDYAALSDDDDVRL